jgi:peptidoglycan/LPS O-acetylase OafA/YrhL
MQKRIGGLDGLRAISIAAVVALHLGQHYGGSRWVAMFSPDGVSVFFVISGFLITTLLLKEFDGTGTISLKQFYLRRTFRIFPPIYTYLLFLLIYVRYAHISFPWSSFLSCVLFIRNYSTAPVVGLTMHTWSLAVEEQFYLIWPPVLIWVLSRWGKAAAARLAVILILISPLLRITTKLSGIAAFEKRETIMLHTRMDILMFGCLAALTIGTPLFERVYKAVARFWWLLFLEFAFLTHVLEWRFGHVYSHVIGMTVDGAAIMFFLVWCTRNTEHPVGRFLNSRPMVEIGVLSYSMYVWQTFLIYAFRWWAAIPLIFIVSYASYRLIEQPALRLRDRVSRKESRNLKRVTEPATGSGNESFTGENAQSAATVETR